MRSSQGNYRVAIVGASTLLGKELATVLEERAFPVSRLVRIAAEEDEPDLPIVDLQDNIESLLADEDVNARELDFVFLASRPRELPSCLRAAQVPGAVAVPPQCIVIDLTGGLGEKLAGWPSPVLSIPFLERDTALADGVGTARHFVSPHPATIVISSVLLRLAARFSLRSALAQAFCPASEMGTRAIEELQKQTVNLLSFKKIPRAVFGAQLAFNLLPRLGRGRRGSLAQLEDSVRCQLKECLGTRVPLPALRIFQTPVFYALAFSLYVETTEPAATEALSAALAGERIRISRLSEEAPSQVGAAGSSDILVDVVAADPTHPTGVWIWAAVDNIRLAAVNAVEIAESRREHVHQ